MRCAGYKNYDVQVSALHLGTLPRPSRSSAPCRGRSRHLFEFRFVIFFSGLVSQASHDDRRPIFDDQPEFDDHSFLYVLHLLSLHTTGIFVYRSGLPEVRLHDLQHLALSANNPLTTHLLSTSNKINVGGVALVGL